MFVVTLADGPDAGSGAVLDRAGFHCEAVAQTVHMIWSGMDEVRSGRWSVDAGMDHADLPDEDTLSRILETLSL